MKKIFPNVAVLARKMITVTRYNAGGSINGALNYVDGGHLDITTRSYTDFGDADPRVIRYRNRWFWFRFGRK